jgi:hypothetical protein
MNRKMVLRNKLKFVQMSRYDNVTNNFMRITQLRDHLAAIREKLDNVELLNVALNDFSSLRNHFSRESTLEKNSQIGRGFGMIVSRKRLERSLNFASKEMKRRRTWLWSIRLRGAKEKVPGVTVRGQPHNQVRRS